MNEAIVLSNGKTLSQEKLSSLTPRKSAASILSKQSVHAQEKLDKVLLVLLDCSGSMSETMGPNSKMEVAWRVFKQELMPNMSGWVYGIMTFREDGADWTVYPTVQTSALVKLQDPMPRGSTPMAAALNKAWMWLRQFAISARIILLTDGCPTDMGEDAILSLAREHNTVPIDTVGIGSGGYGYNPEFLKRLSEITGGMFSEASLAKMLATIILELSPVKRPMLGEPK